MSKLTKAESARINGARSKGPVTPEGKARSAQNSFRHGLAARSIPLANESESRCAEMLAAYIEHFQPAGVVEADLVEELVAARWRHRRALAWQNAALDLQMQRDEPQVEADFESLDGETRQVVALANLDSGLWQNMHRYEIAASRAYHRALRTLRQLQAERQCGEEQNENPPDPPAKPNRTALIDG
jgi:hypothetical protein